MESREEQRERIRKRMEDEKRIEKELSGSLDFEALIEFYRNRWQDSALYEGESLFQKIAFCYGRLHDQEGFERFFKGKDRFLIARLPEQDIQVAFKLYEVGFQYPNLSFSEMDFLDQLFSHENYFETVECLSIDENELSRPLERFDRSLMTIVHAQFTDELLDDVYYFFLENEANEDWVEIKVYDRPSNTVHMVIRESDAGKKTQFVIQFQLKYSEILAAIENYFGKDFLAEYKVAFNDDSGVLDDEDLYSAGTYPFKVLDNLVKLKSCIEVNEQFLSFSRSLSRNWLQKVNALKSA